MVVMDRLFVVSRAIFLGDKIRHQKIAKSDVKRLLGGVG